VLLAVNTFAEGREVLVSRGELVEIGGSFRIPDVVRKAGARLREVGTTNRTRAADFRAALTAQTGLVLKVHPSNFRVVGFTEAPRLDELVEIARAAGLPLVEDLGSGLLEPLPGELAAEPVVGASLAAGVDAVTMSGDKLVGGPQAGLVVGRAAAIDAMRRNPLYRAVRVDKMTIAALEAVLVEHEAGRASQTVPVLQMLSTPAAAVERRAHAFAGRLRESLPALAIEVVTADSAVGGGAAPTVGLPTAVVAIAGDVARWTSALRAGEPAVVARLAGERLLLDLRTVPEADETALLAAIRSACGR